MSQTLHKAVRAVSTAWDVPEDQILSKTRQQPIAEARQAAYKLCLMEYGNERHVERLFCKSRGLLSWSIKRVDHQLQVNKRFRKRFETAVEVFNGSTS